TSANNFYTASPETVTFKAVAHGLSVGDLVNVTGVTPSLYNQTYLVKSITDADNFVVWAAGKGNPGTYSSGGTVCPVALYFRDKAGVRISGFGASAHDTQGGSWFVSGTAGMILAACQNTGPGISTPSAPV